MYYEINVAKGPRGHFFATAKRSIQTTNHLREVYDKLNEAFPESEGYRLSVTYWKESGQTLDPNEDF